MRRVKAREALESLENSPVPVSAEYIYDLTLEATGNKKAAEAAFLAKRNAELRSGLTPA